jgi:hypothetical protein
MAMETKSILFFIEGSMPSEADFAAAKKIGTTKFRNALVVYDGDTLETCDGVAGAVPKMYLDHFPVVDAPVEQIDEAKVLAEQVAKAKAEAEAIAKAKADAAAAAFNAQAAASPPPPWAPGSGK